ncbi:hypothetical protein HU200_006402 [Digitaria exilis]|uniref:Uncharacterized protein n=1 Tax=Digitaria exilis TaxID=1010633 RepID=A0A835KVJ7_9POAL|nr:hypothetical protein HU200_006402 [Digitaria exilis]
MRAWPCSRRTEASSSSSGQILAGATRFSRCPQAGDMGHERIARVFTSRRGSDEAEGLHDESMAKDAMAAGFGHCCCLACRRCSSPPRLFLWPRGGVLSGLNWNSGRVRWAHAGERSINAVFMAVNVRQAGENSIDCSLVAPAVLCCSSP